MQAPDYEHHDCLGVWVHVCNPRPWEDEAEGHLGLYREFHGYTVLRNSVFKGEGRARGGGGKSRSNSSVKSDFFFFKKSDFLDDS